VLGGDFSQTWAIRPPPLLTCTPRHPPHPHIPRPPGLSREGAAAGRDSGRLGVPALSPEGLGTAGEPHARGEGFGRSGETRSREAPTPGAERGPHADTNHPPRPPPRGAQRHSRGDGEGNPRETRPTGAGETAVPGYGSRAAKRRAKPRSVPRGQRISAVQSLLAAEIEGFYAERSINRAGPISVITRKAETPRPGAYRNIRGLSVSTPAPISSAAEGAALGYFLRFEF